MRLHKPYSVPMFALKRRLAVRTERRTNSLREFTFTGNNRTDESSLKRKNVMKSKLIQIALGAIGSIITVLIQYYAGSPADPVLALAGGAGANAMLGGITSRLFV